MNCLNIFFKFQQLANLKINISWDIPISHTIETRISSCPTKEQKKLFKDLNIKIIDGPFTMVEDKIIKKNFKEFCLVSLYGQFMIIVINIMQYSYQYYVVNITGLYTELKPM